MTKRINTFTIPKVLIAAAIMVVFGLAAYNMRDLVLGTPLQVVAAKDGATLDSAFLPLSGVARHARELLINGRTVAIDRAGNFTDAIILSPGYNIVEVALKDRFGNTETRTYHWVVEVPSSVAQTDGAHYQ
ncbi:MAG TPA: hypothetical protein VGE18_00190 [Candidatus Paceibacterota bacterium]